MKTILFLSTHNLATNPRLVKEINLALQLNYRVEVICYIFRNWSYDLNNNLMDEFKGKGVNFHCIEAGRQAFGAWIISTVREKYFKALSQIISLKNGSLANVVSKRNNGLIEAVKKIQSVDWVIGHNPGALWATCFAGKKLNCKMGFDVEDYHPGEGSNKLQQQLTKKLMKSLLPKMDYVSFASHLIMEEVKKNIATNNPNWFTILNYFPKEEFSLPKTEISGRLKLVWFSQNISAERGLELVLPLVKANPTKMELHLYGKINYDFMEKQLEAENIIIHEPVPQKELHQALGLYDVGLALEPAKDLNNDLAISNKILAYLQSGLYILASNTAAQQSFLEKHPKAGICFDHKKNDSDIVLDSLVKEIELIRQQRLVRFEQYQKNNWEIESISLINKWIEACT